MALFWANMGWVEAEPLTLGTRGFSRVRREFSVLAKAARKTVRAGHYKDLTETENRVRKVSGTQGISVFALAQNWTRKLKKQLEFVQYIKTLEIPHSVHP